MLITSDGSLRSLTVLPHAERLAIAIGADLSLLQILTVAERPTAVSAQQAQVKSLAALERTAATLSVACDVRVEMMVRGEDISHAILRVAREQRAEVIALATRGAGAVRGAVLGSVATALLGRSPVPLMLAGPKVAPPRTEGSYELVIATDGSAASEAALTAARALLKRVPKENVILTLLRVYQPALGEPGGIEGLKACYGQLSAFGRRAPRGFRRKLNVREESGIGHVHRDILQAALESEADAILLGTHGHSFRHSVFVGSVAFNVLRNAPLPVILAPSRG